MKHVLIALLLILTFCGWGSALAGEKVHDQAAPAADRAAEEQFRKLLLKVKIPDKTVSGKPVEWGVAVKSELLPAVRVYKYWNRYPRSVIVDIGRQDIVEKLDDGVMMEWIRSAKVTCDTAAKAQALAEFYTKARNEPYSAEKLESTVKASGDAFSVTCTYTRTTVWSPPSEATIAGSRTARYRLQSVVKRDGTLESRGPEEIEVISTYPVGIEASPSLPPRSVHRRRGVAGRLID